MARKKKSKKQVDVESNLKEETKHWMLSIVSFFVAILFIVAPFGKAGVVGNTIFGWLDTLFGIGYAMVPFVAIVLGVSFFRNSRPRFVLMTSIGGTLLLASGLGILAIMGGETTGGIVGNIIASPLLSLFDVWISIVFLFALFLVSLAIIFDTKPSLEDLMFWRRFEIWGKKEEEEGEEYEEEEYEEVEEVEEEDEEELEEDEEEEGDEEEEETEKGGVLSLNKIFGGKGKKGGAQEIHDMAQEAYNPPPFSILAKDGGKPSVGDIKANANIIKRTLQNFGITIEMDEISIGPSVTRYALKPAEGVKLSRIVGLQNDLSLALAAHPIRIEAPIPGKSLVGIEIPNSVKMKVGLGSLFSSEEYSTSDKPLLLALGKSISGNTHFSDLSKMPHLLIAGSTGSGKSVTIHTIINSLLFRNSPQHMRLIMIDPKRVELTLYKGIPHLLTPVITDAKKAILALKWAAKEMDRRYDILETESVRDIASYHKNVVTPAYKKFEKEQAKKTDEDEEEDDASTLPEKMPYIVVIIDELADIMTAYPRELESAIVRLAQMSRAVGIHLILSTQRPSVNIITGLIKANIPARIALQVSSQIDSRTILDQGGAEKLLGAGDMLYMSGEMSKPVRLQSAFISEKEVKAVSSYLRKESEDELPDEITLTDTSGRDTIFDSTFSDGDEEEAEDELYEEARETVIQAGKASSSYLQRKLRVGYARAARLLDMLEDHGVVGPAEGSKPREILEEATEEDDEEVEEEKA